MGSSFPPSGMTFVFPTAGTYMLDLRFEKGDKAIAEASFPLDVQPRSQSAVGVGGLLRVSNDFLKGAVASMFAVLLYVLWRVFWLKKKIV